VVNSRQTNSMSSVDNCFKNKSISKTVKVTQRSTFRERHITKIVVIAQVKMVFLVLFVDAPEIILKCVFVTVRR